MSVESSAGIQLLLDYKGRFPCLQPCGKGQAVRTVLSQLHQRPVPLRNRLWKILGAPLQQSGGGGKTPTPCKIYGESGVACYGATWQDMSGFSCWCGRASVSNRRRKDAFVSHVREAATNFWEARTLRRSFIHWQRTFQGRAKDARLGSPKARSASPPRSRATEAPRARSASRGPRQRTVDISTPDFAERLSRAEVLRVRSAYPDFQDS